MSTENEMTKAESQGAEKVGQRPAVAPPVDIYENAEKLVLVADVPGVAKEGLAIHFEKGQLTFEGRREGAETGNLLATEYRPYDYRRTFALPQGIDAEKITAELESGVLRIHLPKAAAHKPRRIEVRAS